MKTIAYARILLLTFFFCSFSAVAQDNPAVNVTGGGTKNFIPRWTAAHGLGNSDIFQTAAGEVGINTASPAAELDVNGSFKIHGTAFGIAKTGHITFVSGQVFPGTGTITAVKTGAGITGGGNHGAVTVSLDTSFTDGRYAALGFSNTFGPDQFFSAGIFANNLNSSGDVDLDGNVNAEIGTVFAQSGDFGFSTVGGPSVFSNTGSGTQAEQIQSFANPSSSAFVEAQFNANNQATFYTDSLGDTVAIGNKSAAVPLKSGQMVKVFSMESPEVWFEDFGSAQLLGGITTVRLDQKFIQTVNLGKGYHVFVTPKGDCKGLFVTNETNNGFEVRELGGGQSSIDFDYRIVAHRNKYESMRLPPAVMPTLKAAPVAKARKTPSRTRE
jgi:hypothetical protein